MRFILFSFLYCKGRAFSSLSQIVFPKRNGDFPYPLEGNAYIPLHLEVYFPDMA